jgi:hypothetical protein
MTSQPQGTLADLVGEPLPLPRFLPLAVALAGTLADLHDSGRVHGALEPEVQAVRRALESRA